LKTRLLGAIRRLDLSDLAIVVGLALLWVGFGKIAEPLAYIVVGFLLLMPAMLALRPR
jgi:hypothetical protein